MKQKFFFLVMMAAMMAASVNLASCSKDDDTPGGEQSVSLNGNNYLHIDGNKEIDAMAGFDGGAVLLFLDDGWCFGSYTATGSTITATVRQFTMRRFNGFDDWMGYDERAREYTLTYSYSINADRSITLTGPWSASKGNHGTKTLKLSDERGMNGSIVSF